ncbi:MAG: hypothetical protein Kow00117_02940 [Phototrophicales bacterium]
MNKSLNDVINLVIHADPAKRSLGFKYIGKHRYTDALEFCLNALQHDDDDDVRASAAWALDQINSPDTVYDLIQALYDPCFSVRSNASWALIHIARRTIPQLVIPEIIDILAESTDEDARQMAYMILHHIGGKDARNAINRYWKDK